MAKDTQIKKRKASVPEVEAEKVKKPKNVVATPAEAPAKKRKATDDAAPTKAKKTKTPKDDVDAKVPTANDKASKKANGTTIPKETLKNPKEVIAEIEKAIAPKSKKATAVSTKKAAASKVKVDKLAKPEIEADEDLDSGLEDEDKDMEGDSDSEPDDQTKAMLKGFESDGDDEEINDGLPEGASVPVRKQLSKKEEKKLAKIKESEASDKPGVIYIGRIPHGFYENEMRAYFGQFGKILQIRMSRNKKTGAGKHYGWIKFESAGVADIVARTMDSYLMFGHILKVKLIPEEQVNDAWFKGANKRFKKVPWNKMQGRTLEQGKSEETWNEKNAKEAEKRAKKSQKLKEIGYEFAAPTLKSATGVAKPKAAEELTSGDGEVNATEATPIVEGSSKPSKKSKKAKKTQVGNGEPIPPTATKEEDQAATSPPTKEDVAESIDALIAEAVEKPKKGKKVKALKAEVVVEDPAVVAVEEVSEAKPKKEKKVKKTKTIETVETAEVTVPEVAADIPEKKLKTKKSKTSLVETTVTPIVAPEETAKKSKKVKKANTTA